LAGINTEEERGGFFFLEREREGGWVMGGAETLGWEEGGKGDGE